MRLLDTLNRDGEDQARCATVGYDPEWWFIPDTEVLAKAVCEMCLIRQKCLEYALEQEITEGIFGGLTATERELLRKSRLKGRERKAR